MNSLSSDAEARAKKREYMRAYRRKNRAKIRAYQQAYFKDAAHYKKHKESCDKYRKEKMTAETKEKIRQYQREYYQRRKAEADKEAMDNVISGN